MKTRRLLDGSAWRVGAASALLLLALAALYALARLASALAQAG